MYDCKAPLSRFYYPEIRRIINAFIIIIIKSRTTTSTNNKVRMQYLFNLS